MLTDVLPGESPVLLEVDVVVVVVGFDDDDDDDDDDGKMLVRSGQSIFKSVSAPLFDPKMRD